METAFKKPYFNAIKENLSLFYSTFSKNEDLFVMYLYGKNVLTLDQKMEFMV